MMMNSIEIKLDDLCKELTKLFKQAGIYYVGHEYWHHCTKSEDFHDCIEDFLDKLGLSDKVCQTWSAKYPEENLENFIGFCPKHGYENYVMKINFTKS